MRCAIDDLLLPSSASGSGTACEMLAEYWQQIMSEKLYTHTSVYIRVPYHVNVDTCVLRSWQLFVDRNESKMTNKMIYNILHVMQKCLFSALVT